MDLTHFAEVAAQPASDGPILSEVVPVVTIQ